MTPIEQEKLRAKIAAITCVGCGKREVAYTHDGTPLKSLDGRLTHPSGFCTSKADEILALLTPEAMPAERPEPDFGTPDEAIAGLDEIIAHNAKVPTERQEPHCEHGILLGQWCSKCGTWTQVTPSAPGHTAPGRQEGAQTDAERIIGGIRPLTDEEQRNLSSVYKKLQRQEGAEPPLCERCGGPIVDAMKALDNLEKRIDEPIAAERAEPPTNPLAEYHITFVDGYGLQHSWPCREHIGAVVLPVGSTGLLPIIQTESNNQNVVLTGAAPGIDAPTPAEWNAVTKELLRLAHKVSECYINCRHEPDCDAESTDEELKKLVLRDASGAPGVDALRELRLARVEHAFALISDAGTVTALYLAEMQSIVNRALNGEFDSDLQPIARDARGAAQ